VHQKRWSKTELFKLQPRLADAHQQGKITIQDDFPIVSIVKGMTFVLVELETVEALEAVAVAGQGILIPGLDKGWDKTFIGTYFFVHTGKTPNGAATLRTRMIEGPLEDPATGSAASDLAAYLSMKEEHSNETLGFEIVQGVEMGRRSEILIQVEMGNDNSISKIFLEGGAVRVMDGRLEI
jgi:PhzF family phenazine biosynthesis protein